MIVDCHTHIMWYPDHLGEQYAQEALASKLVKLKYSGGEAENSVRARRRNQIERPQVVAFTKHVERCARNGENCAKRDDCPERQEDSRFAG